MKSRLAILLVMMPCGLLAQPAMPAWLVPYRDAMARTKTFPSYSESTYSASATPDAVVGHYRKLLEAAGLAVRSGFDGSGTTMRSAAPECDLLIKVREEGVGSFVRISCAVKTPEMTAVSSIAAAPASAASQTRSVLDEADPPGARRVRVTPMWPVWLVHPDGIALSVDRKAVNAEAPFLASRFSVAGNREAVHEFYSELFEARRCSISSQGKAWLECSYRPDPRYTTRLIVRAEMAPNGGETRVELRVTTLP